jgi:hypothetical protein
VNFYTESVKFLVHTQCLFEVFLAFQGVTKSKVGVHVVFVLLDRSL